MREAAQRSKLFADDAAERGAGKQPRRQAQSDSSP
jgi:hypothetical protein